jgi:hypothetical protein
MTDTHFLFFNNFIKHNFHPNQGQSFLSDFDNINNTNLLEIILNPTNIKQVKSLSSFIKQSLELKKGHLIPFVLLCFEFVYNCYYLSILIYYQIFLHSLYLVYFSNIFYKNSFSYLDFQDPFYF